MTENLLAPEDIRRLSREIDVLLVELAADGVATDVRAGGGKDQPVQMPDKHVAVVEKAVIDAGQEPKSFWVRFKTAAYKDICEKDGVLNAEFKKLGEFTNETVIAAFGAILVSMGFAATPMNIMITYLGANVIRLGVDAFCLEAVAAAGKDGK